MNEGSNNTLMFSCFLNFIVSEAGNLGVEAES